MEFKGDLSFKTITQPGKEFDLGPYEQFAKWFVVWLTPYGIPPFEPTFDPRPILKSSPGTSGKSLSQTSFSVFPKNARALWADPLLRAAYLQFTAVLGLTKWYTYAEAIAVSEAQSGSKAPTWALGKLGVKEEPGKMRVFAMVDWLTQMVMEPLHLWLFSILRHLPMDGTHDQDAAVRYAADLVQKGHRHVFSLDLSAATDRLPVSVQSVLLNQLIPGIGKSWETLLVGRDYSYGKLRLRYAVGQPMGALSSWAMLAMTHHFLVQFAAWRVGYTAWFRHYAILGDDIVILDSVVARSYLLVMDELGVGINLGKSLISHKGVFEFAKRFRVPGYDCSPISLKEVSVAAGSLACLTMLLEKIGKLRALKVSDALAFQGAGYRVLGALMKPYSEMSRRSMMLLVFLTQPGGPLSKWDSWTQWLSSTSFYSALPSINNRAVMLRIREMLSGLLSDKEVTRVVSYPEPSEQGGVDVHQVRKELPGYWAPRTKFYDQYGLDGIHSNTPETTLAVESIVWRMNELATDSYRSARSLYHGLLALTRIHTAGKTKVPGNVALETALKSLVEADALAGAVPNVAPGALFIRKEDQGTRIVVGRWLQRFLSFRASALKPVPSSVDLTVGRNKS